MGAVSSSHPSSEPVLTETCTCGVILEVLPVLASAESPVHESPVHRYMTSSPSCWEAYGRVLACEYEDPARWRTHRYAVDAFAAQHPGTDSPQARNSVGIHLSRLCLLFDRGWPLERTNAAMVAITAKKFGYPWLPPTTRLAGVTVLDVLAADGAEAHMAAVVRWAEAVWAQWAGHHAAVRGWLAGMPTAEF